MTSADPIRRLLAEEKLARRMLSAAFDRIGRPVAIVDERLRLRYANAPARSVLEEGSTLRLGSGRLWAIRPRADERLRGMVRAATVRDGLGGVVRLGAGVTAAIVRVEPLPAGETGAERPLALIVGNRRSGPAPADLRMAYGLTRREAEVAVLFADGLGVRDAAFRLGRSVNTVKTMARALYAKLDVCSHAEAAARIRAELDA